MTKKIKLENRVMVSDPCYTIPTWCQIIVDKVEPGYYEPFVKISDEGSWGKRVSLLMCIHEEYIDSDLNLNWVEHGGTVGVDSGQSGIFSMRSYRNDEHPIDRGNGDFELSMYDEPGDRWYEKMCQRTLSDESWGVYDEGLVSSSGYGDGSYTLFVLMTEDDTVVGFCIDFGIDEEEFDFEFYKEHLTI
jgi:hypothetical protein